MTSVLAVLGILVGVMSEIDLRNTNISAEIHTKNLSFVPANNFVVEKVMDFSSADFNVSTLETDGEIQEYTIKGKSAKYQKDEMPIRIGSYHGQLSAKLSGEKLYLDNIGFNKLSRIHFSVLHPAKFKIGVVKGGFTAEVQSGYFYNLNCAYCSFSDLKGQPFNLYIKSSDSIRLNSQGNTHMTFYNPHAVKSFIAGLIIDELHFFNDDNLMDESSIITGTVKFNDLQMDDLNLKHGDNIKLSLGDNFKIEMLDVGDYMSARIFGTVRSISINGKNQMPSYLNYFYQSKAILLYLGLLSVLVSIVWLLIQRFEFLN